MAKGGGYLLDFLMTAVLFPVMKNLVSYLRTTPIRDVIPLDDHQAMHILLAKLIALAGIAMAYMVMAYMVMAYIVMVYIVMVYIVMAYTVMAYIVMAYIFMAYIVMACWQSSSRWQHSCMWRGTTACMRLPNGGTGDRRRSGAGMEPRGTY